MKFHGLFFNLIKDNMKTDTHQQDPALAATLKHLSAAQALMLEYGVGSLGQVLFKELDTMMAVVVRHQDDLSSGKVPTV